MRISPIEYKSQIRDSINSIFTIEFEIVRRIFPILIGVYKALYFKYQGNSILSTHERIFLSCFQNNLPGIGSQRIKMSWQTFDQIFLNQLKIEEQPARQALTDQALLVNFLNRSKQTVEAKNSVNLVRSDKHSTTGIGKKIYNKKIDFYNNSLTISPSGNWDKKQKRLYLGFFNSKIQCISVDKANKNFHSYQLGNNWSNISAKKPYNYFSYFKSIDVPKFTRTEQEKFYRFRNEEPWVRKSFTPSEGFDFVLKNKVFSTSGKFTAKRFLEFSNKILLTNWYTDTPNKIYSNLDELPIKLNSSYVSNYQPSLHLLPINKSRSVMQKHVSESDVFYNAKVSNTRLNKPKKKNFYGLKILNVPDFFIKKNTEVFTEKNVLKNQTLVKSSCGFSGVRKTLFFNEGTEHQIIDLQGITFKEAPHNPNILKNISCNNRKTVFFLNKENKKSQYFDHFIRQYSSNENVTCFRNYESLDVLFQDIVNNNNKILKLKKNKILLSQLISSKDALKSLKILENFISIDKNIDISPRLMSGYVLPDSTNKSTLVEFKKVHNYFPLEIAKSFFPSQNGLKLDFNTNRIHFRLLSEKLKLKYKERSIYDGPLILQNKITNELQITNPEKLKKWYNQLISLDNPLTDRQQNFFGNYFLKTKPMLKEFDSNLFSEVAIKKPLFIKKKYLRKFTTGLFFKGEARILTLGTKALVKDLIVPSSNKILSTKRFQYIAYLNQSEWNIFAAKLKMCDKLKVNNEFTINPKLINEKKIQEEKELGYISQKIFPLKSTYQVTNGVISWPLNQIDFTTSEKNTNLKYFLDHRCFTPSLPSGVNRSGKRIFGKTYKRTNTIYTIKNSQRSRFAASGNRNKTGVWKQDNNDTFFKEYFSEQTRVLKQIFYQPFEPMTYSSFLYISQRYSLLLFFIYIFKDILKKYQQEIKSFVLGFIDKKNSSNGNDADDLQWNFRIIKNIQKNFDDIGGIDAILPELGEIVWFLRNSVESFSFFQGKTQNTISQAILLTGPPGTGKTLLVQAIAGEAKVPVLIESASSLIQPTKSFNGPQRVKNLFQKAREIAPCIIFIDEIDTFGETRSVMMENPIYHDPILDSIYPSRQKLKKNLPSIHSSTLSENHSRDYNLVPKQSILEQGNISHNSQNNVLRDQASGPPENSLKQNKTNLLMQLLIELDGVTNDKKVLVFAATNRPQILDSALTRPGRFNKVLDLKLPNRQKRIEIIKLYSGNMGVEKNISLDYVANLTLGLSAADLASAINQSSIQAIQGETIHTIETLEYGIHSITGYNTQKNKLRSFINRNNDVLLPVGERKNQDFSILRSKFEVSSNFLLQQKSGSKKLKSFPFVRQNYAGFVSLKNLESFSSSLNWQKLRTLFLARKRSAVSSLKATSLGLQFDKFFVDKAIKPMFQVQPSKTQRSLAKRTNLFFINRIGYYQAGKIIVHTLLKSHPNIISIHLWPEVKSPRHHLINGIREKQFSQIYRRIELESRVIGFYAGKAGELVGLFHKIPFNINAQAKSQVNPSLAVLQSDLGLQDMNLASWLGEVMVNKWYLYSKKLSTQNFNRLKENYNIEQNADGAITHFLQKESSIFNGLFQSLQNNPREVTASNVLSRPKQRVKHPWLQKRITKKFEFLYSNKTDWYRIYSADHKEDENTRYVSPDIYYHSNIYLKKLNEYKFINTKILVKNKSSSIVNWNEIYPLNRDYIYHSLLGTCFNKALSLIDQNRELLDLFVTSLLRKEILREYEIHNIIQGFLTNFVDSVPPCDRAPSPVIIRRKDVIFSKGATSSSERNEIQNAKNKTFYKHTGSKKLDKICDNRKFREVQNTWGGESRRKVCKFINFKKLDDLVKN